eukprot:3608005-Lingulodinium_polyedra.AAC.1
MQALSHLSRHCKKKHLRLRRSSISPQSGTDCALRCPSSPSSPMFWASSASSWTWVVKMRRSWRAS